MAVKEVYVILVREKGLYLVEPVPGQDKKETIEASLGLKSGYSGGLMQLDLPEGDDEFWLAWVETETPDGRPYFDYRTLEGSLTEEEATARLREQGEEPIRLQKTRVRKPTDPPLDLAFRETGFEETQEW
jgi:hypothetical protein